MSSDQFSLCDWKQDEVLTPTETRTIKYTVIANDRSRHDNLQRMRVWYKENEHDVYNLANKL